MNVARFFLDFFRAAEAGNGPDFEEEISTTACLAEAGEGGMKTEI